MKAIIALNNKNYIGRDGKMMWKCSEDFKHFKNLTKGEGHNILIVGATTFEKDLQCRTLPGRNMIIIGSKYHAISFALRAAYGLQDSLMQEHNVDVDIWVIGGESIYTQLAPLISEWHISHIDDDQIGDRSFNIPFLRDGQTAHHYYFKPNPII